MNYTLIWPDFFNVCYLIILKICDDKNIIL